MFYRRLTEVLIIGERTCINSRNGRSPGEGSLIVNVKALILRSLRCILSILNSKLLRLRSFRCLEDINGSLSSAKLVSLGSLVDGEWRVLLVEEGILRRESFSD